jgi:hypothetical protein
MAGLLHICNGHSVSRTLERSGVAGVFRVCCDPLVLGPCPPLWGRDWRRLRLGFLIGDPDGTPASDEVWDEDFERAVGGEGWSEIVLWYEHDLYDQLLLVRLLALSARHSGPRPPLSLVSIDRHPAVPHFKGLGELSATQLAALFPARTRIDETMIELGRDAWAAYSDPDPRAVERLLGRDLGALPFLARALRRHLEEFPGITDGLSRSERQLLALVQSGVTDVVAIWKRIQESEDCHYLADTWLAPMIEGLAAAPALLSAPSIGLPIRPGRSLALTPLGAEVLAGRADRLAQRPQEPSPRWRGGVQLVGPPFWRWDGARLVQR